MSSKRARTTVSAVLIVKDEQDVLEACLASVAWADEIVVYDTGSTDATRDIARRFTDKVVEGYWDDDFGAARNRSLEHASGDWILTIDADEVFEGAPDTFRKRLGYRGATMHTILQTNVHPVIAGPVDDSAALRIFRRDLYEWTGQLHEQLRARPGSTVTRVLLPMPNARLMHVGYRADVMDLKDKATRNLAIAEREIQAITEQGDPARAAVARANHLRSLALAGHRTEALEGAEVLYREGVLNEVSTVTLTRTMSLVAHDAGDAETCDRWLDRWALAETNPAWAYARKAQIASQRGEPEVALAALQRIPTITVNETQQRLKRTHLATVEVWALAATGRWTEAASVAVAAARDGECPGDPGMLVKVFGVTGGSVREVLEVTSEAVWQSCALLAGAKPSEDSLAFLEVMRQMRPDDVSVLTCAAAHAGRMSIEEAMEWSLPIRRAGLSEICPLTVIAATASLDPRQRALAAAIAYEVYEDERALPHLDSALALVPAELEGELLQLLESAAPGLVTPVGA